MPRYCECGAVLAKKARKCSDCKAAALASDRPIHDMTDSITYAQVEQFSWTPRPKPPPILTWEQQRKIDEAVDSKWLKLNKLDKRSEVRHLSRREIAELWAKGEITPIEQIPTPETAPWAVLQPRYT